jgi:hypothetical protein
MGDNFGVVDALARAAAFSDKPGRVQRNCARGVCIGLVNLHGIYDATTIKHGDHIPHEGSTCSSVQPDMPQSRVVLNKKCDKAPIVTVHFCRGQPRRVM